MDCNRSGSSVHGIFQAIALEWIAISSAYFPSGSDGKASVCNAGELGREDLLEKEMATHSSILAWRIPWTKEPGGLQSVGSQRDGHD